MSTPRCPHTHTSTHTQSRHRVLIGVPQGQLMTNTRSKAQVALAGECVWGGGTQPRRCPPLASQRTNGTTTINSVRPNVVNRARRTGRAVTLTSLTVPCRWREEYPTHPRTSARGDGGTRKCCPTPAAPHTQRATVRAGLESEHSNRVQPRPCALCVCVCPTRAAIDSPASRGRPRVR